ncbi:EH domain-binding protein 1-like protein [Schistosoma japonicum]|uniref:EH domain-binding protein 1-like protein n=1 Tax=Schistosoma japonicum TaxID=6182 RepID=A0A4Z2DUS4_SCHJA|nr:EH domain-binding protein 1-like protein [Schistosoma japonicum]
MLDIHQKRMYPSEYNTEDIRCLQTQVRVFKRWVNVLLKQANAKEINDVLEIFTDHENLYNLCKYLASQKVTCSKQTFADHIPHLERAIAILEKLYGSCQYVYSTSYRLIDCTFCHIFRIHVESYKCAFVVQIDIHNIAFVFVFVSLCIPTHALLDYLQNAIRNSTINMDR